MKIVKNLALFLFSIVSVFTLILIVLWFNLGLLVNSSTLSKWQPKLFPDLVLDWGKTGIDFKNISLFQKKIVLDFSKSEKKPSEKALCFTYKASDMCFENLKIIMKAGLGVPGYINFEVFNLLSSKAKIFISDFTSEQTQDSSKDLSINQQVQALEDTVQTLKTYLPHEFLIDVENLKLMSGGLQSKFEFLLNSKKLSLSFKSQDLLFDLKSSFYPELSIETFKRAEFVVDLVHPAGEIKSDFSLEVKTQNNFKVSSRSRIVVYENSREIPNASLNVAPNSNINNEKRVKGITKKGVDKTTALTTRLPLIIEVQRSNASLRVDLAVLDGVVSPYVENFNISECGVTFAKDAGEFIDFKCKAEVMPLLAALKDRIKKEVAAEVPSSVRNKIRNKVKSPVLKASVYGEIREKSFFSLGVSEVGFLDFDIKNNDKTWLDTNLAGRVGISRGGGRFTIEPEKLTAKIEAKKFSKLVELLKDSKVAIPAPINTFTGDVRVEFSNFVVKDVFFDLPAVVEVDLKGEGKNKIKLNAQGGLKLPRVAGGKPEINLKTNIEDAYIHLPPLDPLRGVPKAFSDSRIQVEPVQTSPSVNASSKENKENLIASKALDSDDPKQAKKQVKKREKKQEKKLVGGEEKNTSLLYNISVETSRSDSIRLHYDLLKPYLPLNVLMNLSNQGLSYTVKSPGSIGIEYLSRRVELQTLSLTKTNKNSDYTSLNARLLYKSAGYDIYIDALGSLSEPVLKLSSSPTLSREDIISVLLYNRTANNLSRFENESVGGTEAAIADKAIGLFGIWAFASTPIESVAYDSRTRTYKAMIGLPGGVKLDIGTDWERIQNLSLRKRLNKYWVVVTSFEPGEEGAGLGNMFLQREWTY